MSRPSGERDLLLLEYSRVIEAAEGRQKMKVKKEAEMNDKANKASSNSAESPGFNLVIFVSRHFTTSEGK